MTRTLPLFLATLITALLAAFAASARAADDILPYDVTETTLDNGLKVIIVPTGFPNLVSLQIPVQTGSRNEVEEGKTGFAHFFEHMMFRGTENYPPEVYQDILTRAGASQNAYTTDDYTNYHITFAKEDLDKMLEIEADRFMNLSYPVSAFKTEALAVLGEYNKNFANPIRKLFEVQQNAAYQKHTYKHTTMGFIEDIEDMPNEFDYSMSFFDRWYRPEYTAVIVAGDVVADQVLPMVEKHFGKWKPGGHSVTIPEEPEPQGPVLVHHEWPSETAPLLAVSFHGPAFSEVETDSAALELLLALRFGETSDLYRRLVQEEQLVDLLFAGNAASKDPSLLLILTRVKKAEDLTRVRNAILETVADCREEMVDAERLAAARSHLRYAFVAGLDSTDAIASTLAEYVHFDRSYQTLNNLFHLYERLTPEHLQQAARKTFTDNRLVITTVASDPLDASMESVPTLAEIAAGGPSDDPGPARLLVQKGPSPQIVIKLLFRCGSADDPQGKEGLAALSASMVTDAGSEELEYNEIQQRFYPIAGSLSSQVDREMTVFTASIHRDNLDAFGEMMLGMLLTPGLRKTDFQRNLDGQKNSLRLDLRGNNDEELGKERLQANIFAGTPYGHPTVGTTAGLDSITIADIREFIDRCYTFSRLTIGVSGDVPDEFLARLHQALENGLPKGQARDSGIGSIEGKPSDGLTVEIIEKNTRATALSFGHPIEVTRKHQDYVPLYLARTWLGEHRSSMGRLYQRIREERGMNYGNYAYIEAFPRGMFQFFPDPNLARRAQIFEIWVRPVPPEQAQMALRIALHELEQLIIQGLTPERFESTREYLMKNVFVLTDGQATNLGYHLDAHHYDLPDYTRFMRDRLKSLTVAEVNTAISRHLSAQNLHVVFVTKDAEALRRQLLADVFSPMSYNSEKSPELLEEDQIIGARKLGISKDAIRITRIDDVFAK